MCLWQWQRRFRFWEHLQPLTCVFCIERSEILRIYLHGEPGQLSQYSVWLRTGRPGDWRSIPGRGKRIFPLASVSRPSLGPTQPPIQQVPVVLSAVVKRGRGVTLTTHPHEWVGSITLCTSCFNNQLTLQFLFLGFVWFSV
jgi:hypothetical protein